MKFLRTMRFDASDDHVFERAAGAGEWAVSGAFAFAGLPPERLAGRVRQAFANGFLSVESFGRATFVTVAGMDEEAERRCAAALADHILTAYGAPGRAEAEAAAREEMAFVAGLCAEAPINTLFAVARTMEPDGGIREAFRIVTPPGEAPHARVWDVVAE